MDSISPSAFSLAQLKWHLILLTTTTRRKLSASFQNGWALIAREMAGMKCVCNGASRNPQLARRVLIPIAPCFASIVLWAQILWIKMTSGTLWKDMPSRSSMERRSVQITLVVSLRGCLWLRLNRPLNTNCCLGMSVPDQATQSAYV